MKKAILVLFSLIQLGCLAVPELHYWTTVSEGLVIPLEEGENTNFFSLNLYNKDLQKSDTLLLSYISSAGLNVFFDNKLVKTHEEYKKQNIPVYYVNGRFPKAIHFVNNQRAINNTGFTLSNRAVRSAHSLLDVINSKDRHPQNKSWLIIFFVLFGGVILFSRTSILQCIELVVSTNKKVLSEEGKRATINAKDIVVLFISGFGLAFSFYYLFPEKGGSLSIMDVFSTGLIVICLMTLKLLWGYYLESMLFRGQEKVAYFKFLYLIFIIFLGVAGALLIKEFSIFSFQFTDLLVNNLMWIYCILICIIIISALLRVSGMRIILIFSYLCAAELIPFCLSINLFKTH